MNATTTTEARQAQRWISDYRARGGAGEVETVTRSALIRRDGELCTTCHQQPGTELGHLISVKNGGNHTLANTALQCTGCNRRQGSANAPEDAPEGSEEVDGADIATRAVEHILRFTSANRHQAVLATLYGLATWRMDAFYHFPRLVVTAAGPQAGKTELSRCVGALAENEVSDDTGSMSDKAMQRKMIEGRICLRVDELTSASDEFRRVINAGHQRGATTEILTHPDGGDWVATSIPLYSACVVSGIDALTVLAEDTLSRSIVLELAGGELPDGVINEDVLEGTLVALRKDAQAWGHQIGEVVRVDQDWREDMAGVLRETIGDERVRPTPRQLQAAWPILRTAEALGFEWELEALEALAAWIIEAHQRREPGVHVYVVRGAQWWMEEEGRNFIATTQLIETLPIYDDERFSPDFGLYAGKVNPKWINNRMKESGVVALGGKGREFRDGPRGYFKAPIDSVMEKYSEEYPTEPWR